MDEGPDRRSGSRVARRRARRERLRRNRIIALVGLLVAAAVIAAVVVVAERGAGGATASPAATAAAAVAAVSAGSTASPSASSAPVPSPSPNPTPSPPPLERPTRKHPLHIYFGGDSLAGMPGIMLQQIGAKSGLADVRTDYVVSSRLTDPDPVDWPAHLRQELSSGRTDVGVFMIGANDTGMPMTAGGDFTMYPDKKWLDEYRRRVKEIATTMLHSGVKRVYWVGMPVMPSAGESKKMRALNELFRSVAAGSPDVVYVDSYDLLSKKNGGFDASLRSGDGVHYTDQGAMVVARAVWEAIKKDWRTP